MNGKQLREWRENMDWSQDQAAAALARTRRQYQQLESTSNDVDPSLTAWISVLSEARRHMLAGTKIENRYLLDVALRVEAIDAMPGPGRPKKSLRDQAVEDLLKIIDDADGTLRLAATGKPVTGIVHQPKFNAIIDAANRVRQLSSKS